jgi:hypothetical protein
MAATDYATLQAEAARWAGGSSDTNFPQIVRDAIAFAEVDLDRTLWVPERVKRVQASFTGEYEAIPDDCAKVISIKHVVDGEEAGFLRRQHADAMPGLACTYRGNKPLFYAMVGAQVHLAPKPTTTAPMQARWIYYGFLPRLSDVTSCTAILTSYPQVYLYTVLKHLAPYADDATGAAKWAGMSDQGIMAANQAAVIR